jgi:hypothetical protein
VVPRLSTLTTPPVSSDGVGGTFIIPSRQTAQTYMPDPQYAYLESLRSYPSPKYRPVSILI